MLVSVCLNLSDWILAVGAVPVENPPIPVYWYKVAGKSFGFGKSPDINLNGADNRDDAEDVDYKLSWHWGSYRVGKNTSPSTKFRKVILGIELKK